MGEYKPYVFKVIEGKVRVGVQCAPGKCIFGHVKVGVRAYCKEEEVQMKKKAEIGSKVVKVEIIQLDKDGKEIGSTVLEGKDLQEEMKYG